MKYLNREVSPTLVEQLLGHKPGTKYTKKQLLYPELSGHLSVINALELDKNILGKKLKEMRVNRNMTIRQLAEKLEMKHYPTVADWERGVVKFPIKKAVLLARAFGEPVDFIIQLLVQDYHSALIYLLATGKKV